VSWRQEGAPLHELQSGRLELTKEQQALVLQKIGMEAKELELTGDELTRKTDSKQGV